tara:strand:+ start:1874 stop:2728 length:855 start_codon:yes stop_codon:yes gene_type:complete
MNDSPMALNKLSNAEYHALDYVSKSHLDLVDKSPFHYWDRYINPDSVIPEPTKQMIIGSALHALVLEPDVFKTEFIVEAVNTPKRPTATQRNAKKPSNQTLDAIAYWDEFDEKAKGKKLISIDDYERLTIMKKRIFDHPAASTILNMSGVVEQSYHWKDSQSGELCKSRPDFHTDDGTLIVDLKTTSDASELGFQKSVHNFRYHVQAGFYLRSIKEAQQFVFIAVESKPPYLVAVYNASTDMINAGNRVADKNLATIAQCRKTGKWTGYSEEITTLDLPHYNND